MHQDNEKENEEQNCKKDKGQNLSEAGAEEIGKDAHDVCPKTRVRRAALGFRCDRRVES
jgi:hypothetical protein